MSKTADVSGGTTILTAWGNEVRDRTVQVFASTAERDAAYPIPNRGQCCYIYSGDIAEGLYTFDGVAWRPPWNTAWGWLARWNVVSDITNVTVLQDLTAYTLNWTAVLNRCYLVQAFLRLQASGTSGQDAWIYLTDGANVQLQSLRYFKPSNLADQATVVISVIVLGNGPTTVKVRAQVGTASSLNILGASNAPDISIVQDIGPQGDVPS